MEILEYVVIAVCAILVIIYGIYPQLKANNIFMKNPSKKRKDYLNGNGHY